MKIQEVIANLDDIDESITVYAKKADGEFRASSSVALVELSDDEIGLPTNKVAALKCPGYEYFMEVSLIKEFIDSLQADSAQAKLKNKVEQLISYVEYDA